MSRKPFTRRDFLRAAAVAPLAGAVASSGLAGSAARGTAQAAQSRVILIRDKEALGPDRKVASGVVERMLDEAMTALFGEVKSPQAAWMKIIKPDDVVGIKTNVWNRLPTGPEIEQHLKRRVMDCGVPAEKIGIADRGLLNNPLFTEATALVNVRPGRTHHWSGVGSCIKNMIMFSPQPYTWHDDSCADLAKLWDLPYVKGKVRLNILVMLTPLFHGIGPHHYSDQYIWDYKGLLVGTDPVAVDAVGVRILEARRREFFGEERPLQPPAHHVVYADTRHGLGVSDLSRIDLVRLGWREGALI
ncbi:MAG: DUF362 domain-containing protein [Candidatus Aminicenantes bacterium]|nr:DUF362 domain-containing protein [Candidatus Aminicenantes bacterium]